VSVCVRAAPPKKHFRHREGVCVFVSAHVSVCTEWGWLGWASFYSQHREHAYDHLLNDKDRELFAWVRAFNPYDLYSKADAPPNVAALKPFYEELIAEFFPPTLNW
jgi:hypothetical protein